MGFSEEVIKQAIKMGTRKDGGLESPGKLVEFIKEGEFHESSDTEKRQGLTQTEVISTLTAQAKKGTDESVPRDCSESTTATASTSIPRAGRKG